MLVMEDKFWTAALALALLLCEYVAASVAAPEVCIRPTAGELILGPPATCIPSDPPAGGTDFVGVFEGDEGTLQRITSILDKNREQYVAVLFYSSLCPFSKICRPIFNIMPSLFPIITHFAFEESVIRPSILSRHGVHGFPTLFLLNSTTRVRYHGPRNINYIAAFYYDVTGVRPTPTGSAVARKTISLRKLGEDAWADKQEHRLSWPRSPESLLQQDIYLAIASSFVLFRLLYFLLPKLCSCIKSPWDWQMRLRSLIRLCEYE